MTQDTKQKPPAKRARKMAREPKPEATAIGETAISSEADASGNNEKASPAPMALRAGHKPQSKTARVLALLRREGGASLNEMVAETGWLPHSTRAALTGLKKRGHAVTSEKVDGVHTYRVAPSATSA